MTNDVPRYNWRLLAVRLSDACTIARDVRASTGDDVRREVGAWLREDYYRLAPEDALYVLRIDGSANPAIQTTLGAFVHPDRPAVGRKVVVDSDSIEPWSGTIVLPDDGYGFGVEPAGEPGKWVRIAEKNIVVLVDED